MRIAVVGLGGVGGYLAASFAKSGLDVVGFGRGEHLKVIEQEGITIVEDEATWSVALEAKELREAEGIFDIVLFCVKSYDLEDAYGTISGFLRENSIVVSFSNGVNNGERLRALTQAKVLDGAIYILAHIEKPGVIRKKGKVFAAVFGGEEEATAILAKVFEMAHLRYKTPQNIKEALWKKYIFISAFATLTSYYKEPIGAVYEKHFDEAKRLLTEIAQFAKESEDIELFDEVQKSLQTAKKVPYDSSTSMALDFKNGKKTELESLSGYVQKPFMQKLYNALKLKN